jgi:hypothetical protein
LLVFVKGGLSKGTTRVIGETVLKAFQMFDSNKNEKSIRLLGVAPWSKPLFPDVIFFYFLKQVHKYENF